MMPPERAPTFGALLRRWRLAAGLSQEALAERARLSLRGISDLERGARQAPREETVALLADALCLSPSERAALARSVARARPRRPAAARPPLPATLTSFIGRERALTELRQLFAAARLVTLTGAGGCGKTRLALRLAEDLAPGYPDGMAMVELASLSDPALVPQAVASRLGVRERGGRPLLDSLAAALRERRFLLVLDNCEHLAEACARLAETLLRACPNLRLLATSRAPLLVAGEVVYRVPSLAVPPPRGALTPGPLGRYAAVALFVDRAQAAQPGFALTRENAPAVAQVCTRLDGIPLAIELAAVRVRALSVEALADRLDDCFRLLTAGSPAALPRQQTLRAAIDWSYDLLSAPEQRLFRRLAVFAGGWTLEAAEAVCAGDGVDRVDIADLLARLVDKSLALAEEHGDGSERYRLLETLRQYGRERLTASAEEAAVRQRHAAYYLAVARVAVSHLGQSPYDRPADDWLRPLDDECGNLRMAMHVLLERGAVESVGQIWEVLQTYCFTRGLATEGGRDAEAVLGAIEATAPSALRARALARAGYFVALRGDLAAARTFEEQALACYQALDDRRGIAHALGMLGTMVAQQGDVTAAAALYDQAQAVAREAGDRREVAHILLRLGDATLEAGDIVRARAYLTESAALAEPEDRFFAIRLPHHMGVVALAAGAFAEAREQFCAALYAQLDEPDPFWLCASLVDFVHMAAACGHVERSLRLAGAIGAVLEASGERLLPTEHARLEHWVRVSRRALGDEAASAAWAQGRSLSLEQAIAEALAEDA